MTDVAVREPTGFDSPILANRLRALSHSVKKLNEPGAVELTPTALVIRTDLPYETYEHLGAILGTLWAESRRAGEAIQWAIGDWILFGEGRYDERQAQAAEQLGRSVGAIQDWARVAERVLPRTRRPGLSFAHHRAVASMETKDQKRWLDRAEEESIPRDEFARLIRDENPSKPDGSRPADGPATGVVVDELEAVARRLVAEARDAGDGRVVVSSETVARLRAALGMEER